MKMKVFFKKMKSFLKKKGRFWRDGKLFVEE